MSKKRTRKSRIKQLNKLRKSRRSARQVKLGFEHLEPRHLLTAVTVNSLDDLAVNLTDNVVTLRDAIFAANGDLAVSPGGPVGSGADTIVFDPALSGGTIALTQALGDLDITSEQCPTVRTALGCQSFA